MRYRPYRRRQIGKVLEVLDLSDSETDTPHVSKKRRREPSPEADTPPPSRNHSHEPEANVAKSGLTLVDLPVEIWFEVFEYVDLLDLLRLTRTCKVVRGCLMRPSVANIWKRARKNVLDGLPECPPDLDEPSWASLALDNFCHFCGAKATKNVLWELRRRSCKSCFSDPEIFSQLPMTLFSSSFPCDAIINSWRYGHRDITFTDELDNFRKATESFGDDVAALKVFIGEKIKEVEPVRTHASACREWEYRYNSRKRTQMQKERDARMKRRRKTIQLKLNEAGYEEDLKNFKKRFPGRFENHVCVAEGGELTEKEWSRIKPILVEVLKEEEKRRVQREHNEAIAQLATRPEFEGKRVSRSMFKALKK